MPAMEIDLYKGVQNKKRGYGFGKMLEERSRPGFY